MKANKLILNIAKTNYILFGTRNKNDINLKLYYGDKDIERVHHTKFLGFSFMTISLGTTMLITYVKLFQKILNPLQTQLSSTEYLENVISFTYFISLKIL